LLLPGYTILMGNTFRSNSHGQKMGAGQGRRAGGGGRGGRGRRGRGRPVAWATGRLTASGSKEQTDARETGLRKVREEIRLRRCLK
jgi:hypothetical protein